MKSRLNCKFVKIRLNYHKDDSDFLSKLDRVISSSTLTVAETNVFYMMFNGFGMMHNIKCDYFSLAKYTDGKYTLNVRKDLDERITILFDVNPNYSGLRQ